MTDSAAVDTAAPTHPLPQRAKHARGLPEDLTGQHIGWLTVEQYVGDRVDVSTDDAGTERRDLQRLWRCRCECGAYATMTARHLQGCRSSGIRLSCSKCAPIRAAERRVRMQRTWGATTFGTRDDKRKAALHAQWARHGNLWPERELYALTMAIRGDVYTMVGERHRYHYDGPTTLDVPAVWVPNDGQQGSPHAQRSHGGMTLAEVARRLPRDTDGKPMSRERVRQIEQGALYKLACELWKIDPAILNYRKPIAVGRFASPMNANAYHRQQRGLAPVADGDATVATVATAVPPTDSARATSPRNKTGGTKTCGRCGKRGHNNRTCPLRTPTAPALPKRAPDPTKVSCSECHQYGHNRATCHKRIAARTAARAAKVTT